MYKNVLQEFVCYISNLDIINKGIWFPGEESADSAKKKKFYPSSCSINGVNYHWN